MTKIRHPGFNRKFTQGLYKFWDIQRRPFCFAGKDFVHLILEPSSLVGSSIHLGCSLTICTIEIHSEGVDLPGGYTV